MQFEDLTGQRFGRLTVIERAENVGRFTAWKCICDCGNYATVMASHLKSGHTTSCGCYMRECSAKRNTTHNETNTRLYRIWQAMKRRCYNPKAFGYSSYGGSGIKVCEEWHNSYESFRNWSLENGYREDLTIDRIDNSKGYSPDNCRWATTLEQSLNRRVNRFITYNGKTQPISEWAKELGINYHTLHSRLTTLGWSVERALCK